MGQSLTSSRSLMFHGDEQPDIKLFDFLLKPQNPDWYETKFKLSYSLLKYY